MCIFPLSFLNVYSFESSNTNENVVQQNSILGTLNYENVNHKMEGKRRGWESIFITYFDEDVVIVKI